MADSAPQKAPLEDVMAAMDVVDTLRHQHSIAERELDGAGRRARLLERLRELYQAQGIEVPDRVLEEGIDALEQERFRYTPVTSSWRTRLAYLWVSRARWGKPVGFLAALATLFIAIYLFTSVLPQRQLEAELPRTLQTTMSSISAIAKDPSAREQASALAQNAERAIDQDDYTKAKAIIENLQMMESQLAQTYTVRVVSRPNQNSGIWRHPPNNSSGRNYYLIVEAVDGNNAPIELLILNQENNRAVRTKTWGLRVDEATFYKVAADKEDDGIIQGNQLGKKAVGYLTPTYNIPTTGATITEW